MFPKKDLQNYLSLKIKKGFQNFVFPRKKKIFIEIKAGFVAFADFIDFQA